MFDFCCCYLFLQGGNVSQHRRWFLSVFVFDKSEQYTYYSSKFLPSFGEINCEKASLVSHAVQLKFYYLHYATETIALGDAWQGMYGGCRLFKKNMLLNV